MDNKTRKILKQRAHSLKPTVMVGDKGLTEAVLAELDRALTDHELVKIRLPAAEREARKVMATAIIEASSAIEVQSIGRVLVLFRRNPEANHSVL